MSKYWVSIALVVLGVAGCSSGGSPDGAVAIDATPPSDASLPDTRTGAVDAPPDSPLPTVRALTNVVATQREDSVGIDFDPVPGAVDYRVYPLPDPGAVTAHADGSLTVQNAIYRCAGLRQTFDLQNDTNGSDPALTTFNPPYNWHSHTLPTPTLGHVYVTPGTGRLPVYAIAGYPSQNEMGWREARLKIYTTDVSARAAWLAQGWRDDGIVFYVPDAPSAGTQTVYGSQTAMRSSDAAGTPFTLHVQYYFTSAADLATHMSDTTAPAPAFQVLTSATAETQPLMGVLYENNHVELAVGPERYQRALNQGNGPLWHVEWAGLTQPTTLVVEALATGCPFQGMLSAQHLEVPPHQTLFTLPDLQAASPTGEVFINGQYDGATAAPVVLARSYVQVTPQPESQSDWDWYQGFGQGTTFGPVTNMTPCTWTGCSGQTSAFDFAAYELDQPMGTALFTFGVFQGQLWEAFDDTGSDVTGRVRFTARTMGQVMAGHYLHVRMSVNIVSTDRRYPQMVVSDQPSPIDCFAANCNGLGNATSNTLLVQPIQGPSARLEVQAIHGLVHGGQWNVNNQAPEHRLLDGNPNYALSASAYAALNTTTDAPFEHAGVDRMTRFDAYVGADRVYVYMDGAPAGCTQYPSSFALSGPVTVTFGDVLYHEGATDELVCAQARPYAFLHRHQCQETSRHFDDLGFRSGADVPAWDTARFPCNPY